MRLTPDWHRRSFLQAAASLAPASLLAQQPRIAGKLPMILHNDFPEDLEALPEYLDTWITPYEKFFVRQHLPRPKVDPASFRVELGGLVNQKLSLSVADLRALPQYTVPATLECAGNGRGNFRPRMPGLQWTKGAIGNAEWRGPRLADVLKKAGVKTGAAYVDFNGADTGLAKTPDFIRSIPLRKVLHPATLLALDMNGAAVPELHGGPVRLIVPGWDGASWVKWVTTIEVVDKAYAGFYMNPAYRYPKNPVPPGTAAKPEDLEVLEGMAVKSFFARPANESRATMSPQTLTGAAWAGEHRITRVDISTDGGATWTPAQLSKPDQPFAWRIFNFTWKPTRAGYHTLCSRATDSAGRVQPIEAVWNPSGYLWNPIDRIGVTVEG